MLSRLFIKKQTGPRLSPLARTLLKLADMNMSSANCTLTQTAQGEIDPEDLGRVLFFKSDGRLLIQDRAIYVTIPDGIKADKTTHFNGNGDIVSLWFLYDHVPRILECHVDERIHFPPEILKQLDPKVGIGYKLTPTTDISKQDKRSSLRFSHLPGEGVLPVYSQVLFDLYICNTDQRYPEEGAILPSLDNLGLLLPDTKKSATPSKFVAEDLVRDFKQAMCTNPSENRNVHISKPFFEEKHNRAILLELGYSGVLGLGNEELGRNLHIKKPLIARTKDRRDPHYLTLGDILVLHYGTRNTLDGHYQYAELIAEIAKGGLENLTVRPLMNLREEQGLWVPLADFSVNGARFGCSHEFLSYILGKNYTRHTIEEQIDLLQTRVLRLNFYPKLRFNRETDIYRPEMPQRISILGKIVRCEIEWEDEEEQWGGKIVWAGVKFMYDPTEYSRDDYEYTRWEMIRVFKENRYFKSVHKSLNGLIAYLESQSKDVAS